MTGSYDTTDSIVSPNSWSSRVRVTIGILLLTVFDCPVERYGFPLNQKPSVPMEITQ